MGYISKRDFRHESIVKKKSDLYFPVRCHFDCLRFACHVAWEAAISISSAPAIVFGVCSAAYAALSWALTVTILRVLLMLAVVVIPPIIKTAQEKKKARMKDEADRKEQERRESMGDWK